MDSYETFKITEKEILKIGDQINCEYIVKYIVIFKSSIKIEVVFSHLMAIIYAEFVYFFFFFQRHRFAERFLCQTDINHSFRAFSESVHSI